MSQNLLPAWALVKIYGRDMPQSGPAGRVRLASVRVSICFLRGCCSESTGGTCPRAALQEGFGWRRFASEFASCVGVAENLRAGNAPERPCRKGSVGVGSRQHLLPAWVLFKIYGRDMPQSGPAGRVRLASVRVITCFLRGCCSKSTGGTCPRVALQEGFGWRRFAPELASCVGAAQNLRAGHAPERPCRRGSVGVGSRQNLLPAWVLLKIYGREMPQSGPAGRVRLASVRVSICFLRGCCSKSTGGTCPRAALQKGFGWRRFASEFASCLGAP